MIANQKQAELRLNREMGDYEKLATEHPPGRAAGRAERPGGRRRQSGRVQPRGRGVRRAAGHDGARPRGDQGARAPVLPGRRRRPRRPSPRTPQALQGKLAERQKLLSQLDQAKMQEQMNTAMSSLGEDVGEDVPGFDEIRDKIEARYAKAKGAGRAEHLDGVRPHVRDRAPVDEQRGPGAADRDPLPARHRCRGRPRPASSARDPTPPTRAERYLRSNSPKKNPLSSWSNSPGDDEVVAVDHPGRDAVGQVGAAPTGGTAEPAASSRLRPLANTTPSGPATSTASSASKRPVGAGDAGRQQRRPASQQGPPGALVDR